MVGSQEGVLCILEQNLKATLDYEHGRDIDRHYSPNKIWENSIPASIPLTSTAFEKFTLFKWIFQSRGISLKCMHRL
jgi:hypothetical protein